MELERRAIEIRPRSPWEACDLGIQMGRHWWWPMVKIWLALASPWLLLSWCIPARFAYIPALLYWLGKPLLERFLLYFLSQAIFTHSPSSLDVLKNARQLLAKDWLASLLWRRLSLWRAYNSALTVLEGQTGPARRQRLAHLAGENASTAAKVMMLIAHMEGFLLLSLWVLAYTLVPQQFQVQFVSMDESVHSDTFAALYNTLYILVSSLVAPFFVATGFALYLNRRIWLEAWDIDISFRTLAKRLSPALLLILLGCLWSPAAAPPSLAAASYEAGESTIHQGLERLANPLSLFSELQPLRAPSANYPAEQAKVATILAGADFHHRESRLVHHWRWSWPSDTRPPADDARRAHLVALVARVLEVLAWMAVLALIMWLGLNYRKLLSRFATTAAQPKTVASPLRVFGLDVRAASLPDDPAETAFALCLAHNYRQGLAILYRATLVALLQQGLKLKASHTEEDCLTLATRLPLSLAAQDYLRQLTHTWQQLAYGHLAPAPSQAEQLCRQWALHWSIQAQPHA
ncbi:MAG: DUF4129 domain-containing protein [Marinagarivorans sp.]